MRGVVQRVKRAKVTVDNEITGSIDHGILLLLSVEDNDDEKDLEYMCDKVVNLRIFEDENDKMNMSLLDVGGSILVVSQFTLHGDARKGRRPSFIAAARPDKAIPLYEKFIQNMKDQGIKTTSGKFGADMQVELVNDGPVTILLDSKKTF
ncbi:D-tyrosyl-tRNA(Tyr) deacylase [Sedimentibacter acidaminivorans]|jgi:D-aminoacyl-tRNA deacylase|uniref:D-aminoacyl-tRNA deacylase n=1 Tax=Sedimentibacter acidaminivorans TaxID=913099 RepID=A0ABS4GBE2_9FIRM|nr:D-aminoacyl-tRNA deacylase [Sedimentibacter acidaminivorans]MBP1925008.1 D-tyrosyl-tRNA(Tyr) deacylase [Sedimentibacter acidaminivorans]